MLVVNEYVIGYNDICLAIKNIIFITADPGDPRYCENCDWGLGLIQFC